MNKVTLTTLLLLSAAVMTAPASANWFFRPGPGISLNVGSAPNPTPNDLRALYGPSRYAAYPVRPTYSLRDMYGKTVYGQYGEVLGYVLAVNETAGLVQVQLPTGIAVSVDATRLINEPGRVSAPTLSYTEILALAEAQTGRRMALTETLP